MASTNQSPTRSYFMIGEDGKERSLEAIDDSQATGLCQKRYPGQTWKLYRITDTERVEVCVNGPDCPGKNA